MSETPKDDASPPPPPRCPPGHDTDSLNTILVIIDEPGDRTVRPMDPNLPRDWPRPNLPRRPGNGESPAEPPA